MRDSTAIISVRAATVDQLVVEAGLASSSAPFAGAAAARTVTRGVCSGNFNKVLDAPTFEPKVPARRGRLQRSPFSFSPVARCSRSSCASTCPRRLAAHRSSPSCRTTRASWRRRPPRTPTSRVPMCRWACAVHTSACLASGMRTMAASGCRSTRTARWPSSCASRASVTR